MWKVFLTGSSGKSQETAWQDRLKKEFEGKYTFLRSGEFTAEGNTEPVSLDSFLPTSSRGLTISSLSVLSNADVIVSNITNMSPEVFFQLFYSNLVQKPIFVFSEEPISTKDLSFVNLLTENFFDSFQKMVEHLTKMQVLPVNGESQIRDLSFMTVQREIASLFAREDRKDSLFRAAILATQIGQLLHYLTHDRQINPGARNVGSRDDEEAQLGDCLIQLLIYSISRNFNISDVYSIGVTRMEENVWRSTQLEITSRELRPKEVGYGIGVSSGVANGRVAIVRSPDDASKITAKCIVVMPEYTKPVWDEITDRMDNVAGLISGTGSPNSHPAIVCRELKKPCIVSAADLVRQLKDDEIITMTVGTEIDDNSVTRDEN